MTNINNYQKWSISDAKDNHPAFLLKVFSMDLNLSKSVMDGFKLIKVCDGSNVLGEVIP